MCNKNQQVQTLQQNPSKTQTFFKFPKIHHPTTLLTQQQTSKIKITNSAQRACNSSACIFNAPKTKLIDSLTISYQLQGSTNWNWPSNDGYNTKNPNCSSAELQLGKNTHWKNQLSNGKRDGKGENQQKEHQLDPNFSARTSTVKVKKKKMKKKLLEKH